MTITSTEIQQLAKACKTYARGSGESGLGPFMDKVGAALEQLQAQKEQLTEDIRLLTGRLEHGKELLRQEMQRAGDRGTEVVALRQQLVQALAGIGQQLPDKDPYRSLAVHEAICALYFADNYDYRAALVKIVDLLDPAMALMFEHSDHAAYVASTSRVDDVIKAQALATAQAEVAQGTSTDADSCSQLSVQGQLTLAKLITTSGQPTPEMQALRASPRLQVRE